MSDLTKRTIQDFGEQWTSFRDNPAYYGSAGLLQDLISPFLSLADLKGLRVADIGSGTGRIVNMLLDANVAHVHAVEPSAAMQVARSNTADRAGRITYVEATGEKLPPGLNLDLVVSMGVLHHVPDPGPIVAAALKALKPGGRCLIWLYGREGNEVYLGFAEPLRWLTVRLPHKPLVALCYVLGAALDAYIALCKWIPLPSRRYMTEVLAKFPRSIRRLTIYDQLNPAYAKYYRKHEAIALLADNGFDNVRAHHRHGYSWTVVGTKSTVVDDAGR
jgi:SAM-dependent methyltransferase